MRDEETLAHVGHLLQAFDPDRDAGFFNYVAQNVGDETDAATRMLSIAIAFLGVADPAALRAVYSYTVAFCVQFEALAASGHRLPLEPGGLIDACVRLAAPHPATELMASFLQAPEWRARAETGIATLIDVLFGEDPGFWLRIARHFRMAGALDDTERLLRRIVARTPEQASPWLELGFLMNDRGSPSEAVAAAREGAGRDLAHAEVQFLASLILLRAGDPASAQQFADRALAFDPGNTRYRAHLASIADTANKPAPA